MTFSIHIPTFIIYIAVCYAIVYYAIGVAAAIYLAFDVLQAEGGPIGYVRNVGPSAIWRFPAGLLLALFFWVSFREEFRSSIKQRVERWKRYRADVKAAERRLEELEEALEAWSLDLEMPEPPEFPESFRHIGNYPCSVDPDEGLEVYYVEELNKLRVGMRLPSGHIADILLDPEDSWRLASDIFVTHAGLKREEEE